MATDHFLVLGATKNPEMATDNFRELGATKNTEMATDHFLVLAHEGWPVVDVWVDLTYNITIHHRLHIINHHSPKMIENALFCINFLKNFSALTTPYPVRQRQPPSDMFQRLYTRPYVARGSFHSKPHQSSASTKNSTQYRKKRSHQSWP